VPAGRSANSTSRSRSAAPTALRAAEPKTSRRATRWRRHSATTSGRRRASSRSIAPFYHRPTRPAIAAEIAAAPGRATLSIMDISRIRERLAEGGAFTAAQAERLATTLAGEVTGKLVTRRDLEALRAEIRCPTTGSGASRCIAPDPWPASNATDRCAIESGGWTASDAAGSGRPTAPWFSPSSAAAGRGPAPAPG
jgi:hypothetical protein